MNVLVLDRCRVCGSKDIKRFYTQPYYPLTAGVVTSRSVRIPTGDIVLGYCFNCGTCSIVNKVADIVEYNSDYTSSNLGFGQSQSMDKITGQFLDFIGNIGVGIGSKILEIGCYDGSFMDLMKSEFGCDVAGCEPCAEMAQKVLLRGFSVYVGNFRADVFNEKEFDIVVIRNVLEHMPSPSDFMAEVKKVLKPGGHVAIEVPDGEFRIAHGILGSVVPEHPCYFGVDSLSHLLGSLFEAVMVQADDGLIRAVAQNQWIETEPNSLKGDKKKIKANFRHIEKGELMTQNRRADLYNIIMDLGKLYVYGANTCSVELISGGCLKTAKIAGIFDDDRRKWGKYLVNSVVKVSSPAEISAIPPDSTLLICSYRHMATIAERLMSNLARPFCLIRLYPDVKMSRY